MKKKDAQKWNGSANSQDKIDYSERESARTHEKPGWKNKKIPRGNQ